MAGAVGALGAGALIFNSQRPDSDSSKATDDEKAKVAEKFTESRRAKPNAASPAVKPKSFLNDAAIACLGGFSAMIAGIPVHPVDTIKV